MNQKKETLLKILQRSNKPITGKELAKQLGCSTRTIINYINQLNNDSKESFILSGQDGYYIDRSVSLESQDDDVPQDRTQRMFYLLRLLLLSGEEGTDAFDLADEMYISYSLLKKEISDFNEILRPYDVSIISRNNTIMIEGEEKAKRRVMTSFIQKSQGENILNDEKLRSYFSQDIVDPINDIIRDNIRNAGAYINEFSRLNLLLHLSVIANRLSLGKQLQEENEERKNVENRSESLAYHIINDVERSFDIRLNNTEYAQMSALIQSHVHLDSLEPISEHKNNEEIYNDLKQILLEVYEKYYLDFLNDGFLVPFSLHIENLLMRLQKDILIDNPIKESFRNSSPFLYDIAIYIVNSIKKRYQIDRNVSDNELTFLVMHLALELERQKQDSSNINCLLYFPRYLGMENNLLNKIRIHFEDMITIAGVIHSEEEIDQYEYDILISFVNADVPMNKKYVRISPLLSQQDYSLLNDAITQLQQEKLLSNLKNVFPLFFKEDNFVITHENLNKYEVIHLLSEKLKHNNQVKDGFEEQVIQREDAISTGYINFAVPHGVSTDVNEQSVAVLIAPDGIMWSDKRVYCVMLMAVNPEALEEFQNMYNALLLLLMETDCVERFRDVKGFPEFRQILLSEKPF